MSTGPSPAAPRKTTILTLREKRERREPITMVTAYDFPTARLADEAGLDAILVGDSLPVLGHPDTPSVTIEETLHRATCGVDVRGGAPGRARRTSSIP